MVKYKICLQEGKEFKELIWNKDSYANFNNYRLSDIDNFTSKFEDNLSLREELVRLNVLKKELMHKKLGIRYLIKGHMSLMQYGLVLKDDKAFFSIPFIRSYLKSKKKDTIILEKLCNHYRNSYVNGFNVTKIRNYIDKVLTNEVTDSDVERFNETIDNFVDREVYQYDNDSGQYVKDENDNNKIIYKNLHGLAMFLSYDYKKRLEPSIYEKQNPKIEIPKVKKKKDQINGQYSLFE